MTTTLLGCECWGDEVEQGENIKGKNNAVAKQNNVRWGTQRVCWYMEKQDGTMTPT